MPASGSVGPVSSSHLSHRLWLEGPEFINRWNRYLKFVLLAVVSYALGMLFAFSGGILSPYLASPAFAMGAAGVAWVATSIPTRARRIDLLYSNVIPTFPSSQAAAEREIRHAFAAICDKRRHFAMAAVIMTVLTYALYCSFFLYPLKVLDQDLTSLRPIWFTQGIYTSNNGIPGAVVVTLFAFEISVMLGTALWLMFAELKILKYLCTLPVPPLPEAVRVKLRPIADFHVQVARDWSIGALLFVFLFMLNADVLSLVFVGLTIIVAGCVFAIPQVRLRRIVMKAHRRAVDTVLDSWIQGQQAQRVIEPNPTFLAELATISTPPGYWVYGSGQIVMWFIAQATAMCALVIQVAQSASHQ